MSCGNCDTQAEALRQLTIENANLRSKIRILQMDLDRWVQLVKRREKQLEDIREITK